MEFGVRQISVWTHLFCLLLGQLEGINLGFFCFLFVFFFFASPYFLIPRFTHLIELLDD